MTLTVLFDLDDTLLTNDVDTGFLPAYIKALSEHLKNIPADKTVQHLLSATRLMMTNQDLTLTLQEVFDNSFYTNLEVTKTDLQGEIDEFYLCRYPDLKETTQVKPQAIALIDQLIGKGHDLVVATNPLFPKTAIDQRLYWAGLPPNEIPFKLITSYENFHFSKSSPAYYAEILADLGWLDQPAVMIGDSLRYDVIPASILGIPVFWLNGDPQQMPANAHPLSKTGLFESIAKWVEDIDAQRPAFEPASHEAITAILRSTPIGIKSVAQAIPDNKWTHRPVAGEWCLTEIICHLRDIEIEINLPRFDLILNVDNPFLPGVVTDPWASERNYILQNGPSALSDFTSARVKLINFIDHFSSEDWTRKARHAIFGPTQLGELIKFIAIHDRTHINQAHRLLSSTK